jgi:hypothetical protein
MKNFELLIQEANETADLRKSAYQRLKREAPAFEKFAAAMLRLGYSKNYFYEKLYVDQESYPEYNSGEEFSVVFDFTTLEITIGTEIGDYTGERIFDGETAELDFSKNVRGSALLDIMKRLPQILESSTSKKKDEISKINNALEQ